MATKTTEPKRAPMRVAEVGVDVNRVAAGPIKPTPAARVAVHSGVLPLFHDGLSAQDLGRAVGSVDESTILHAICTYRVSLSTVIVHAAEAMGGGCILWLVSWSLSVQPVAELSVAQAAGLIKRLRLLSSDRFLRMAASDKREMPTLPPGAKAKTGPIHAKIAVLWSPRHKRGVALTSSANLNNNRQLESYVATGAPEAVLFYLRWFGICWAEGGEWKLRQNP